MLEENKNTLKRVPELFFKSIGDILDKPLELVRNWKKTESASHTYTTSGNRKSEYSYPPKKFKCEPIDIELVDSLLSDNNQLNESVDNAVELSAMQSLRKRKCDVDNQISPEVVDNRSPLKTPDKCYEFVSSSSRTVLFSGGKKLTVTPLKLRLISSPSSSIKNEKVVQKLNYESPKKENADSYISPEGTELIGCPAEEESFVNIARISDSPVASYSIENIKISDSETNMSPVKRNGSGCLLNSNMYEYIDSSYESSVHDSISVTPKSKSKRVRNRLRSLGTLEKNQRRCARQPSSTLVEYETFTNGFVSSEDTEENLISEASGSDEMNKENLRRSSRQITLLSTENGTKKQLLKKDKWKLVHEINQSDGENLSRSFETEEENQRKCTRQTSSILVESETFESSEDTEETVVSESSDGDDETNKKNLRRSSRKMTLLSTESSTKQQSSKKDKSKLDSDIKGMKSKNLRSTRNETRENNSESKRIKKGMGKDAARSSSSSDSDDDTPLAVWRNQPSKQMNQKSEEDIITDLEDSGELFRLESRSIRKKSMAEEPSKLRTPRTRYSLRSSNQVIMEEEQEIVVETSPRTPKSIKTIKRNSFCTPKMHIKNLTHSVGERRTPGGTPTTPRERARMVLLGSAAPESLPCRENEFKKVYDYLFDKIKTETGGFMYISGAPGTGKTATVERVVKKLVDESKKHKLPDFKVIEINGVRLTNPREVYRQIWRQFSGKTVGLQTALNSLNELFQPKKSGRKRSSILLIIDEFDCLSNKKQDVMYKILEWQKEDNSRLIVLSIANTFDFFENKKLFSRMKFDKVPFIAYTFRELEAIILNRLQGIHVFAPEAIEFMARKVAALTGDARRALNISRQVLDITREEDDDVIITIDHVVDALKKILSDPVILKIKRLHIYQKLALRAIRDELLRTGSSECSLKSGVLEQFKGICSLEGLNDPDYASIRKAFHYLADFNFIRIDQYPFAYDTRMWLNAEPDSIHLALNATKL